jgi:hypothetical protein
MAENSKYLAGMAKELWRLSRDLLRAVPRALWFIDELYVLVR